MQLVDVPFKAFVDGVEVEIERLGQEPMRDGLDPQKIYAWRSRGTGRSHTKHVADQTAADSAGMFCGYFGAKSSMGRSVREMLEGLGVKVTTMAT